MDDTAEPPDGDRLCEHLEAGQRAAAVDRLDALSGAETDAQTDALRSLRDLAERDPDAVAPVADALAPFLTADGRAARLTAAKTFVALAQAAPDDVRPVADALADRLSDDAEFYYVRARTAEAIGYVAGADPDVVSPAVLADLRVGLAFDEPEVRTKLAKALEHVALGDPARLRHQVADLADHLDDDSHLVRYHLATTLVVVATAVPDRVAEQRDALTARLGDDTDYVRGRAAEAIGVFHRSDAGAIATDELRDLAADDAPFVAARARFALTDRSFDDGETAGYGPPGFREAIARTTDEILADLTSPDADGECPHCGLALHAGGPPLCPRCGAPQ